MREISAADLVQVIDRGGVVVDVREIDEYLEGHVPGAISVPLSRVPENIETF
ncbi:MAG: rhodanese-like domain-containing protein, partial [Ilumatobacteraceae bacterium]